MAYTQAMFCDNDLAKHFKKLETLPISTNSLVTLRKTSSKKKKILNNIPKAPPDTDILSWIMQDRVYMNISVMTLY